MSKKLPVGFRPMSTFKPEEPALLFDAVHDTTLPWPGGKKMPFYGASKLPARAMEVCASTG